MDHRFSDMPLVEALYHYGRQNSARFHMPGHKGDIIDKLRGLLENHLYRWDVTEIPGLDDLHAPSGAIKEAQAKLARLYDADGSFFLVNGATSGVMAMMGATLKTGDKAIVSRASHKSIMSGMIFTGVEPLYIVPEVSRELGIHTQITPESLCKALDDHPDARATILPHITYQGFCTDMGSMVFEAEKRGIPMLVDEAHGPHLAFSPKLPPSAGEFPVAAWVQSPHKMLTSLTQSAWLHTRGTPDFRRRVMANLALILSSSPSYILMASLDMSRGIMEARGRELVEGTLERAQEARVEINRRTPFYCIGDELVGTSGIYDIDLSRLMVNVSTAGYTGFEVEASLRQDHNIYAEYADHGNVYFLVGFTTSSGDLRRLAEALSGFNSRKGPLAAPVVYDGDLPQVATSPRNAFFSEGEAITLHRARAALPKKPWYPIPPGYPW